MILSKKAIKPLAKIHGYWLYQRFLKKTEAWDLERRREYVTALLLEALIQANAHVPFYQRRFREIGFEPQVDFKGMETMTLLPTLTKVDLRESTEELIDRRYLRSSVTASTSGSTGEPTRLYLSERYVALDYACMFRHWAKAGYSFRQRFGALRTYAPKNPEAPVWRYSVSQNTLYLSAYQLRPSTFETYLKVLLKYRPKFLRGYPSALAVFADLAFEDRDKLGFVQGVFTASETLKESERSTIERTFGPIVFDWYGMTEPAVVITERQQQDCMRVEWVYGYPEFLPAGNETGTLMRHLVTTSLHNPVMPLIRYETGDAVELVREEPEEGELYPDVRAIYGRKDQVIVTREGGRLPSLNFYSLFQDYREIIRFQFIQETIDRVEVRLLFRKEVSKEERTRIKRELEQEVGARLGRAIELEMRESVDFVCSGEGKIVPFVIREF